MTVGRTRTASPAAIAVIGLLALGIAAWVVLNSAFFDIRDVRVMGARSVSEEEIRAAAEIPFGENLIMLRTERIASRLESHPWIREATVDRDLPGTVVIHVVERRAGGWLLHPDGVAVVAGDGTVVTHLEAPPSRLPELGSWPEPLTPGQRIDRLEGSLRVAASMAPPLRRQVESVSLDGTGVILRLRQGGEVIYGPPTELDAKNRALARMLDWAEGEGIGIRTVDVRVASAPSLEPV